MFFIKEINSSRATFPIKYTGSLNLILLTLYILSDSPNIVAVITGALYLLLISVCPPIIAILYFLAYLSISFMTSLIYFLPSFEGAIKVNMRYLGVPPFAEISFTLMSMRNFPTSELSAPTIGSEEASKYLSLSNFITALSSPIEGPDITFLLEAPLYCNTNFSKSSGGSFPIIIPRFPWFVFLYYNPI